MKEAIRLLSTLKEAEETPQAEIDATTAQVDFLQKNLGEPTERHIFEIYIGGKSNMDLLELWKILN